MISALANDLPRETEPDFFTKTYAIDVHFIHYAFGFIPTPVNVTGELDKGKLSLNIDMLLRDYDVSGVLPASPQDADLIVENEDEQYRICGCFDGKTATFYSIKERGPPGEHPVRDYEATILGARPIKDGWELVVRITDYLNNKQQVRNVRLRQLSFQH